VYNAGEPIAPTRNGMPKGYPVFVVIMYCIGEYKKMNINDLFPLFASLIGFPALVAAAVNVAKYFGVLPDGSAPKVVFWVNLVGFVGVGALYFTGNLPLLTELDKQFGSLALFLMTLVSFIGELGFAKLYHAGLKGTPVIGKSASQ